MNTDVIDDLKQFNVATTSQLTADVRQDTNQLNQKLYAKVDNLAASVGEVISSSNKSSDGQAADHEEWITKLVQSTA